MLSKIYLAPLAITVLVAVFFRGFVSYIGPRAWQAASDKSLLILVSIDGFRFDYLERGLTPTLLSIIRQGVLAPLAPQYPSYTFPNHYTLVTGLLPSNHGIVSNHFYDPVIGEYFSHNSHNRSINDSRWWLAQPIWNSAEMQGIKSAILFWPGSEVQIRGWRPSLTLPYDARLSSMERIDQLLEWIGDGDDNNRPGLAAAYLADVDTAGHLWGPESSDVDEALVRVDAAISHLIAKLAQLKVGDYTLVIVGDHGMSPLAGEKLIVVEEIFDNKTMSAISWMDLGSVSFVIPIRPAVSQALYQSTAGALKSRGIPCKCYTRAEIATKYRCGDSPRIAPILIDCAPGYSLARRGDTWRPRGQHGYDPGSPLMETMLIAAGPKINQGVLLERQSNLDVYNLLAALLGVPAEPNDGSEFLKNLVLIN